MQQQTTVTVYRCGAKNCDVTHYVAKNCDVTHYVEEHDEAPHGFHGSVMEISDTGGAGGEWYACSAKHLKAAILAAVELD